MVSEVVILDEKRLEDLKKNFLKEGKDKIHVLADFDRTLTKTFVNNKKVESILAQIRDGTYLSDDYAEKAKNLAKKYYPIEINPNINDKEKSEKMYEWWNAHFDLLIKSGLNREDIARVVREGQVEFREGVLKFLDFLNEKNIPLIIMSSSGLGEAIPMYLKKEDRLYKNIFIITNSFEWDKNGNARKVKEPIIHIMNKSEISIKKLTIYDELKKRKNVLLLGDSLGDVRMIEGFNYDNLISIGFLDENVEESLEKYKKSFNVVILRDGNFDYVNKLVESLK